MIYCSYEEGMFSTEPVSALTGADAGFELQAACVHEAAHAVVSFLLGEGCHSIEVTRKYLLDEHDNQIGLEHDGCAKVSFAANYKVSNDLQAGLYTPALAANGIATAAGPAAERRFRIENNMPLHQISSTAGDHRMISAIAEMLELAGRRKHSFPRLVWRAAHNLLVNQQIWDCIKNIAVQLSFNPVEENIQFERYYLSGDDAIYFMEDDLRSIVLPLCNSTAGQ